MVVVINATGLLLSVFFILVGFAVAVAVLICTRAGVIDSNKLKSVTNKTT